MSGKKIHITAAVSLRVNTAPVEKLSKENVRFKSISSIIEKQNTISIIQSLFNGFSAVIQGRSWFDQNMLPICPEVILPEGMGTKSKRQDRKKFSGPNANMNIEFLGQ